MTGDKGERTVNGHLLCLQASIESLDLASSICNFKAPGRALKRCVHSACLFSVCVCGSLLICVPWVNRVHSSPLCTEWGETRAPSRHEITDYTLNASPRGLNRAQESQTERVRGGRTRGQVRDESEKNKQEIWRYQLQTSERKQCVHRSKQLLKDVSMTLNSLDWA